MVERSSSRVLFALIAALGIALGAACNKQVSAQESTGEQPKETRAEQDELEPVGGGPVEAEESEQVTPREQREQLGADDERAPLPTQDLGEDEANEQPEQRGPTGDPDEDDAQESDEEPDEENWRTPIRGSGGDNPPDFIETSEPKTV